METWCLDGPPTLSQKSASSVISKFMKLEFVSSDAQQSSSAEYFGGHSTTLGATSHRRHRSTGQCMRVTISAQHSDFDVLISAALIPLLGLLKYNMVQGVGMERLELCISLTAVTLHVISHQLHHIRTAQQASVRASHRICQLSSSSWGQVSTECMCSDKHLQDIGGDGLQALVEVVGVVVEDLHKQADRLHIRGLEGCLGLLLGGMRPLQRPLQALHHLYMARHAHIKLPLR